ncbi:MAG: glycosyltransferase family 9 protein [Bdellovibrionales bacterium]|nr:glycosyltransferase family 9 protein [Bdellovibrionales bacterium]
MRKRHPQKDNILLVNITRLGDMLQATPTIAGMKMENPECRITVLVEKQFESICYAIPNVDEVVSIDLGMTVRSLAREQEGIVDAYEYVTEMVDDLRSRNFDYTLNMSSSAYTALLLRLVGIERRGGWTADEEGHRVIESDWAQLFATSVFHQNRQYNSLNLVDVFRCSADVETHPHKLLLNISEEARRKAGLLLEEIGFPKDGPFIMVQAGASQAKRQWDPSLFIEFIRILTEEHGCRILLSGTGKELPIIEPILQNSNRQRVFSVAGKTGIPELGALLEMSELLVTGDTGPMHMSVAAGTPVVSMFLASAFGFETGPYSPGNIVLQPVIGCGPCNPNKACSKPECHDTISPQLLARLTMLRYAGDFTTLPPDLADERNVVIYRSNFDQHGFCDLTPLNRASLGTIERYRSAYRRLWLDDLGDIGLQEQTQQRLKITEGGIEGLQEVVRAADEGVHLVTRLQELIHDSSSPPSELGKTSDAMTELDRKIEQIGYFYPHLGPLTRMFIFGKENILGSDPYDLASQMKNIYQALGRRSDKLARYF